MTSGTLYGVGVGPGDPELLTVKALRVLGEVSCLACPADPDGGPGRAYRVVERYLRPHLPVLVLRRGAWDVAGDRVAQELASGRSVAFVTLGDPLLYSTFAHLLAALRRRLPHVPVTVVPGVSSVQAAASELRVPLATGGEQLVLVPASYHRTRLRMCLRSAETVVFLKVHQVISDLVEALRHEGLLDAAALVEQAGCPDVRVVPARELAKESAPSYTSLLVVRHLREGPP